MKRPALAVDKGTSNSDPIGAISRRSVLHLSGLAGAGILMPGLLAGCRGSSNPSYEAAAEEARTAAGEVLGQGQVTSLVIALTDAQGLVWVKGFGLADRSTAAAPTGDTLYGIGSGSKMYAAVAVMQLVERGQVDLDAPFHQYVPQFTMFSPESMDVTVRMLLDHSSGLPGTDFRNVYSTVPGADYHTQLLDTVSHQRLKARPGYMSVYCNDGFTLVESLVKAVTGLDYPAYVAQNILAPLGMTRSQYGNVLLPEGTAAKAYGADGAVRPQEYSLLFATGGLFSTANEHAAFARALLNGGAGDHARILTPASVSAMGTDQTVGTFRLVDEASFAYGLGWDSVRQPGLAAVGVRAWSKGGDTINYHSETLVAPDQGLAVVVLLVAV